MESLLKRTLTDTQRKKKEWEPLNSAMEISWIHSIRLLYQWSQYHLWCCRLWYSTSLVQICLLDTCGRFPNLHFLLYLSVSKTGVEMYFEAIVLFNTATNVDLKIMEHNINYKTTNFYNNGSLTTSSLTTRSVFKGAYSIGLTYIIWRKESKD